MEKVAIRIEGISGLLMHRFAIGADTETSKAKNRKQTQDDPKQYLYLDEDGKLVQPSTHIIGCLKKAGARFQVVGQGKLTYKNILGSGAVIIDPDMIPHEMQAWEVDRRPVVVNGKSRVVRERPFLKKWALSFDAEYDDDEINRVTLKEILDYAGRRVGIGDFRPEKGGPFGRFHVTKFE